MVAERQPRCGDLLRELKRQIVHPDFFAASLEYGDTYDVLQFPHVSRPRVCLEKVQHLRCNTGDKTAGFWHKFSNKVLAKGGNILAPFAQWRYANRVLIQAIEEILAKLT